MDTVRLEGSVLIPIETVSRTLEEKKLGGMYHLGYLSPMAHNVIEWVPVTLHTSKCTCLVCQYTSPLLPTLWTLPKMLFLCRKNWQQQRYHVVLYYTILYSHSHSLVLSGTLSRNWNGCPTPSPATFTWAAPTPSLWRTCTPARRWRRWWR